MSSRSATPSRTPTPSPAAKSHLLQSQLGRYAIALALAFCAIACTIIAISAARFSTFCKKSRFLCTECPKNAECHGKEFTCVNGTFKFYRICARPGAVIRDYDETSHRYFKLQKAIYDAVVALGDPTVERVLERLAKSKDEDARRLDATDVENLWTYEGNNYYIDDRGVLVAHSRALLSSGTATLLSLGFWCGVITVLTV